MDSTPNKKKVSRYQALPAEEDEDENACDTSSLYSSPNGLVDDEETNSLVSLRHPLSSSGGGDAAISPANDSTNSPTTPPRSLSRANSKEDGGLDSSNTKDYYTDDDDDDNWEDDLQRYSFVYTSTPTQSTNPTQNNNNTTATASSPYYTTHNQTTTTPRTAFVMAHWRNLRSAARQRRAARLLSMTNDTFHHRFVVGFLNTCCDATDTGIAVAAILVLVWVVVGVSISMRRPARLYWMGGLVLFALRVSARRLYEWWRRRIRADSWKRSMHGAAAVTTTIPAAEQEVV